MMRGSFDGTLGSDPSAHLTGLADQRMAQDQEPGGALRLIYVAEIGALSLGNRRMGAYRPIVMPGVPRNASPIVVAFLSSMTSLVMTVVWLGMLMIGPRDEDKRLALYGATGSAYGSRASTRFRAEF
jgi:hypothetical protein